MKKLKAALSTKKAKLTILTAFLSSLIACAPLLEPYLPDWAYTGLMFGAKLANGFILGVGGLF
ncbi:hypothetical protein [Vibrio harveyi]|uniref:hypothetical protein n=1 Tax=Vibrio harveyi TaxID=669 RepID=UPI00034C8FCE|nr:hypothetical protein [Vibrio harveyi]